MIIKELTSSHDLVNTGGAHLAYTVGRPAAERAVVHVADRGVVESADGPHARVPGRRHICLVSGVVEGPLEGHHLRVRVHLTLEVHRLVLQGAVQFLPLLLACGYDWGSKKL